MPRWKPDAQQRLQRAALELFIENGYDGTTVAEIAERAGLMRRSFFRYFPDKREVVFAGAQPFTERLRSTIEAQPLAAQAWDVLMHAMSRSEPLLTADRQLSRTRRTVIAESTELRERNVLKTAQLADVLDQLLQDRGTPPHQARVLARLALLVYEQAFDNWLDAEPEQSLPACFIAARHALRDALNEVPEPGG